MSENKNNDDILEFDLPNDSEETLQINFDDLNTDVEISFDDIKDSIDVTSVDDNQPIENIELMRQNAPHNEPEDSINLSLEDDKVEDDKVENDKIEDDKVENDKVEDNTLAKEPNLDMSLIDDTKEDTTPVASTEPNSDPLGMDWSEPFNAAPASDHISTTSSDTPKKDVAVNISDAPTKKKTKKVPVIIGAIVAVLALLASIGYYLAMVNPVTSNAIMATVLKPNKYYQMIEGKNINAFMKKSFKNMDNNIALVKEQANGAIATTSTITLSEGLTSIGSSLGAYGTILQSIKTVTLKTDSLTQDSTGSYILQIGLNDKTIIDVNIVLDNKNNAMYIQCPSILKRWIKIPINTAGKTIDFSKGKKLDSKDMQTIMQKYIPILISNFDNVKLNKGKNITVNKTKVDVSIIEISISKENREKILKIFVDELKDDDLVYSYLESYGFFKSKKEYTEAVSSLTDSSSNKDNDDNTVLNEEAKKALKKNNLPITMIVYVDKSGTIVGRDIKRENDLVGYKYYDSGKVSKLAFEYKTEYDNINALGDIKENNKTYSGSTTITYTKLLTNVESAKELDKDSINSNSSYKFILDYKNIKKVNEKKGLFKGNFTLSTSEVKNLTGISLNLNYSVQNNKQASEVIVNYMDQPMVTMATTQDTSQQSNVTVPSKFIEGTQLSKDYLTQYNTLLELDTYTPVVTLMNSLNNSTVKQLVAAYYVRPGYNKLNGKQTAKDLIYIAKLNKNTNLYKLAIYGYKMTIAGKNPGLNAK